MTKTQIIQLTNWREQGKLEYRSDFGGWCSRSEFSTHEKFENFRIKSIPTLRPWQPEEVPVGAIVSCDSKHTNRFVITGIWNGELHLNGAPCQASHEHSPALNCLVGPEYHYSLDHGKTWLPCGVLE